MSKGNKPVRVSNNSGGWTQSIHPPLLSALCTEQTKPQRALRQAELGAATDGTGTSAEGGAECAAENSSDDRVQICIVQFDWLGQKGRLPGGLFIHTEASHIPFGRGVFEHGNVLSF